MNKNIDFR